MKNNFPYALENDIDHLVIWSKHVLQQPEGYFGITPENFKICNDFVESYFADIPKENIVWFRNFGNFRSVKKVEVCLLPSSPIPFYLNKKIKK